MVLRFWRECRFPLLQTLLANWLREVLRFCVRRRLTETHSVAEEHDRMLTQIRETGLMVPNLCFGASSLGDMPDTYGYGVSEAQAYDTVRAIFDGPVNFLDTSNNYGFGRSETRIGHVIRERGGLPDGFVLATKLAVRLWVRRWGGLILWYRSCALIRSTR